MITWQIIMVKKILYFFASLFAVFIIYLTFIFDINNYKSDLENIISNRANIEFKIAGDLELDIGIHTHVRAKSLSVSKNNVLLFESETFNSSVSLSQILRGRFDINSLGLTETKLYGINIDESIIKSYNLLAGKSYNIKNKTYSIINLIEARGFFEDGILEIEDILLETELIQGDGFGKINTLNESVNVSTTASIKKDDSLKSKYNEFYPKYLLDTQLPILISGNFINPNITINVSDIITEKLKKEIKDKAINSIKDKIKEKIKSEINIKLPF